MQHQAFATARHHLVKARLQGLAIGHAKLLHQLQPGNARPGNDATQAFDPVGEGASPVGLLEHHVLDLPPVGITGHLAAHDARQGIKAPTGDPQLPVQGLWRQAGDEPGRRMNRPPTAKTQAATVPHRPGTIELLADPVAGDIHLATQHLGQEQGRCSLGGVHLGHAAEQRQHTGPPTPPAPPERKIHPHHHPMPKPYSIHAERARDRPAAPCFQRLAMMHHIDSKHMLTPRPISRKEGRRCPAMIKSRP